MAFSEKVKIKALVACGRSCCICHKFCGNNIEIHHIKAHADGGDDSFENAIPLCFDCHAIVRQYDPKHPKGTRFSEKELIGHRDLWYRKISQEVNGDSKEGTHDNYSAPKLYHQKDYQKIKLLKVNDGKELLSYMKNACGIAYDDETKTLEEAELVGAFLQNVKDLLDIEEILDEPSNRIKIAYELTNSIIELDDVGFWVFAGVENQSLVGRDGKAEGFPVFIIRIVRKNNPEIIKK